MKIAVINEVSASLRNEDIMKALHKTTDAEILNVGMKTPEQILPYITLLLHVQATGDVRLNMENSFLLRLTLPFPVKKSVITIPVSAVSLPESLAIRKFWLMSQPQKKSMAQNACFSVRSFQENSRFSVYGRRKHRLCRLPRHKIYHICFFIILNGIIPGNM